MDVDLSFLPRHGDANSAVFRLIDAAPRIWVGLSLNSLPMDSAPNRKSKIRSNLPPLGAVPHGSSGTHKRIGIDPWVSFLLWRADILDR